MLQNEQNKLQASIRRHGAESPFDSRRRERVIEEHGRLKPASNLPPDRSLLVLSIDMGSSRHFFAWSTVSWPPTSATTRHAWRLSSSPGDRHSPPVYVMAGLPCI